MHCDITRQRVHARRVLGSGPGASTQPLHLMSMLRRDVRLKRKGRQLINAQQLEEQGRLRTAARFQKGIAVVSDFRVFFRCFLRVRL